MATRQQREVTMATGGGKPRQPSLSAPRALPALNTAPIPLDALLARAGALAQPHRARPSRHSTFAPSPRVSPHADETPRSLLLSVTISHCACGATIRSPAPYVLVRYAENAHTVHYRATGPDAVRRDILDAVPREVRETHVDVPFCEECFNA